MTAEPRACCWPRDSLSLIITTSPTPSAPSTELISEVIRSFHEYCPELLSCAVVVVFDVFDHVTERARLKKGRVTVAGAASYAAYKENIKNLIKDEYLGTNRERSWVETQGEAEYGLTMRTYGAVPLSISTTDNKKVTFIEPSQRLGFGLAVRSALRLVETPYVWVQQHDWVLASTIPVQALVSVMADSVSDPVAPVHYVAFPAGRMLSYAKSANVQDFPGLRTLTASLKRTFTPHPRQPRAGPEERSPGDEIETGAAGVPLTPLFLWHDKPHVAATSHYLSRVFPTPIAIQRGAFIEDSLGQRAREQMKRGEWHRWATWLYYPDDGTRLCLRHLQGRTWRGKDVEREAGRAWRERNAAAVTTAGGHDDY